MNDNYLKDYSEKPKEILSEKISFYKSELIALHPFFELNGRITRLFFDMIAFYNGYDLIDYSHYTPQEYIDASIECVQFAKYDKMKKIIFQGLQKSV